MCAYENHMIKKCARTRAQWSNGSMCKITKRCCTTHTHTHSCTRTRVLRTDACPLIVMPHAHYVCVCLRRAPRVICVFLGKAYSNSCQEKGSRFRTHAIDAFCRRRRRRWATASTARNAVFMCDVTAPVSSRTDRSEL